jgi:hypothetical protein
LTAVNAHEYQKNHPHNVDVVAKAIDELLKQDSCSITSLYPGPPRLYDICNQLNVKADDASSDSKLLKKISSNSESLWKSWLKLQPNRLTQDERKILNDYTSILDMISSGDETTDKIYYYRLVATQIQKNRKLAGLHSWDPIKVIYRGKPKYDLLSKITQFF